MKKFLIFLCVASMLVLASGYATAATMELINENFDGGLGSWHPVNTTWEDGGISASGIAGYYAKLGYVPNPHNGNDTVTEGISSISKEFYVGTGYDTIEVKFDWYLSYQGNKQSETDSLSFRLMDGSTTLYNGVIASFSGTDGTSISVSGNFDEIFTITQSSESLYFSLIEDRDANENSWAAIDNIWAEISGEDGEGGDGEAYPPLPPPNQAPVPEPCTALLLGSGLVGMGIRLRKKILN